jgi:hypothetical protein
MGLIALIVPGIILGIRYSLIDEVVILEGAGVRESRLRSTRLVSGKGLQVLLAGIVAIVLTVAFSFVLGAALGLAGALDNPVASSACDCLIDVFAVIFVCVLFLYYWEARQQELKRESEVVDVTSWNLED